MTRLVRLLALAAALQACGTPDGEVTIGETRAAVRSGSPSLACEWPAVVALDLGCSATLVHPEVVVYAAHCGTGIRKVSFGEDADRPARVVETRRCEAHPRAALGNGFDVAFCLLGDPVADVPVIPIAAGCELEGVRAGMNATLVGFGVEHDDGAFGVKRSAPVVLGSTGPDLVVEAAPAGSCAGDSGGPLLIDVPSSEGGGPRARLIGVLSAAAIAACEPSTEHYSYLPALLSWLERESGRDLTPCFASDGRWAPGPKCAASRPASGSWSSGCSSPTDPPEPLATCGPAFEPELVAGATRTSAADVAHCAVLAHPMRHGATPWIASLAVGACHIFWRARRRRREARRACANSIGVSSRGQGDGSLSSFSNPGSSRSRSVRQPGLRVSRDAR